MQYLRFLKLPRIESASIGPTRKTPNLRKAGTVLSALITITSDLGENYLLRDVEILANLRRSEGTLLASQCLKWTSGMRQLKVEMALPTNCPENDIILEITPKDAPIAGNLLSSPKDPVLPVWSSAIGLGGEVQDGFVERRLDLDSSKRLSVWEESGNSIARHIWDGGFALAAYIAQAFAGAGSGSLPAFEACIMDTKQVRALEIGSGTGIVGLALATLSSNCTATLTDLSTAKEIVSRNMKSAEVDDRAKFAVLDWNEDLPPEIFSQSFDILLVADCMYNVDAAPALVGILTKLVGQSPDALIVLGYKKRHDSEDQFFDLMRRFKIIEHTSVILGLNCFGDDEVVDLYTMRWAAGQ